MSVMIPILAYAALLTLFPLLLMFADGFIDIHKFTRKHFAGTKLRIFFGFFFVLIVYPTLYALLAALFGTLGALILIPVPFIYVWVLLRMAFLSRTSTNEQPNQELKEKYQARYVNKAKKPFEHKEIFHSSILTSDMSMADIKIEKVVVDLEK